MAKIASLPKQPNQMGGGNKFRLPVAGGPSGGGGQTQGSNTFRTFKPNPQVTPGQMPGQTPPPSQGGGLNFPDMKSWQDAVLKAGAPYAPGDSGQIELEARDPKAAYERSQQMGDWRKNNLALWRARPGFMPGQGAVPNVDPDNELAPEEAQYGQGLISTPQWIDPSQLDAQAWANASPEVLALKQKIETGRRPDRYKNKVLNPAFLKAKYGNKEYNDFQTAKNKRDGGTYDARQQTEPGRRMNEKVMARRDAFSQWSPYSGGPAAAQATQAPGPIPGAKVAATQSAPSAAMQAATEPPGGQQRAESRAALLASGGPTAQAKQDDPNRGRPGYIWNGRAYAYDPTADPGSEVSQFIQQNPKATSGQVQQQFPELNPPYETPPFFGTPGEGPAFRLPPGSGGNGPPTDGGGNDGGGAPPSGVQSRGYAGQANYGDPGSYYGNGQQMGGYGYSGPSQAMMMLPMGGGGGGFMPSFEMPGYDVGGGGYAQPQQLSQSDIGAILASLRDNDPVQQLMMLLQGQPNFG